ncbi:MAG: hypothetical protein IPM38_05805 [Ignavibacteria bacterium]|nr:hypothetical protein [Ignavibacteria bacterium]
MVIIAKEIIKGDEVLTLRDDNGYPYWAGWRKKKLILFIYLNLEKITDSKNTVFFRLRFFFTEAIVYFGEPG